MFSIYSLGDEAVGDLVYGKHTGMWPTVDDYLEYANITHEDSKNHLQEVVYALVTDHKKLA